MKRFPLLVLLCWAPAPAGAQQGTLLINELLFQPVSGEAEYVELYNPTSNALDLAGYHIVRWVGDSLGRHYALPTHTMAPHDYVVLTKDAASVATCFNVKYPSKVVECHLPAYPNGGGSVILATVDSTVVDRLDYRPDMHSRLLRDKAGVSLERRSPERPTNEASNWFSAASTAGYGTPGYENSQSSEWLVEESSFVFSSTLLSPDGDEYQDMLEISYQLDRSDLAARAEVYSQRGTLVRRLLNNDLLGSHGTLQWDGRDDAGALLPQGQYIVQITLFETAGTYQTLRRTVALMR